MPRLPEISLSRLLQYWWVLAIGLAVATALLWAINRIYLGERFSHPLLDQYAENDIRVGDRSGRLANLGEVVTATVSGGVNLQSYRSSKNPNLMLEFGLDEQKKIVSASFPVTIRDNAKLNTVTLPAGSYVEFWLGPGATEVARVYPSVGIGLVYHFSTQSVSGLFQFFPNQTEAFLARQTWLPRTETEPIIEFDQYNRDLPDVYDLSIDTTIDATRPAEPLP